MPREIRRTGRHEDEVRVIDAQGRRAVLQRSLTQVRCAREPALTIDVVHDKSALGPSDRVRIAEKAEASLADVPLIAEDLLCKARQLADLGAPNGAVKAILDHATALREGRG